MAADAIGLIEHLGIAPCHVLGGSLGALITQTVALTRPDLVRSATLLVGGGNFCRSARLSLEGQAALLETGVSIPESFQQAIMPEATLTPTLRQDDSMVDLALQLTAGLSTSFGPGGQYGQVRADATWAGEDHSAELEDTQVPCLVVSAEHDPYFSPTHLKQASQRIADSTYVEIAGSLHVTADPTAVKQLEDAIAAFLQSQSSDPH